MDPTADSEVFTWTLKALREREDLAQRLGQFIGELNRALDGEGGADADPLTRRVAKIVAELRTLRAAAAVPDKNGAVLDHREEEKRRL